MSIAIEAKLPAGGAAGGLVLILRPDGQERTVKRCMQFYAVDPVKPKLGSGQRRAANDDDL
jgi:hypothetical protein